MPKKFTDGTKKVLALAEQEAKELNHEYLGTEHILLGLIKEGFGVGANILKNFDVDFKRVRLEVEKIVRRGEDMVVADKLHQTPRTKKVLEYAGNYAKALNHNYIGTEHLLYGIIMESEGIAYYVLQNCGLKGEDILSDLEDMFGKTEQDSKSQPLDYWMVPRENMDLYSFIENCGFKLEETQDFGIKNPQTIRIFGKFKEDQTIGKLDVVMNSGPSFEYSNPQIFYRKPVNEDQIKEALRLRDLFDKNQIKYQEERSASKIAKELRDSVGNVTSLADRLEKRI